MKTLLSIIAATSLALGSTVFAAGATTYQVTGPITTLTDTVITVQSVKDKNLWQITRSADTKVTGDLKVGAKVTITYTMTAATVDVKPDKGAKAAASPAASATK